MGICPVTAFASQGLLACLILVLSLLVSSCACSGLSHWFWIIFVLLQFHKCLHFPAMMVSWYLSCSSTKRKKNPCVICLLWILCCYLCFLLIMNFRKSSFTLLLADHGFYGISSLTDDQIGKIVQLWLIQPYILLSVKFWDNLFFFNERSIISALPLCIKYKLMVIKFFSDS